MKLIKEGIRTLLKKWFILIIVLSCTIFALSSGCSEKNKENITQSVVENGKETKVEVTSTGNSDNWCPVGSSWKTTDPKTGEAVTMKVTGIENIDGIPMCKAVYETNINDDNFSKMESLWSQDGNTTSWTAYDKSGKKISEFSMKDGKMRIVDEEGKVTEIAQSS